MIWFLDCLGNLSHKRLVINPEVSPYFEGTSLQGTQSTSFSQGMPRLHAACSMAIPAPSTAFLLNVKSALRTNFLLRLRASRRRVPGPNVTFGARAPVAGRPHSLAFCRKVRCRQVMPPSQVFEQACDQQAASA